jgi:hypothetical protein
MKTTVLLFACLLVTPAAAEPMHFKVNGTGGNHCCWWVQATGNVEQETATVFEKFLSSTNFVPDAVRLNSPVAIFLAESC